MIANKKICPPLNNLKIEILVKLNNDIMTEDIKKQALQKVANKIDFYLVKNIIIITKLCRAQTLSIGDIIL